MLIHRWARGRPRERGSIRFSHLPPAVLGSLTPSFPPRDYPGCPGRFLGYLPAAAPSGGGILHRDRGSHPRLRGGAPVFFPTVRLDSRPWRGSLVTANGQSREPLAAQPMTADSTQSFRIERHGDI